ncbi:MAG: hypothetical protein ACKVKG_18895 [Alphaproteobacteria bacterium]|jgi:hypothetical protein
MSFLHAKIQIKLLSPLWRYDPDAPFFQRQYNQPGSRDARACISVVLFVAVAMRDHVSGQNRCETSIEKILAHQDDYGDRLL